MKKVLLVLHKHVLLGPLFWSFLQRKARDMEEFPKWNLSLKSIIQPKKAEMWVRTDKSFNVEIGQKVAERDNGMWLFSAALQSQFLQPYQLCFFGRVVWSAFWSVVLQSQFLQPYQLCLSFLSLEKRKKITSLVKPSLKTCRVAKNGRMVSNLVSHYIGSQKEPKPNQVGTLQGKHDRHAIGCAFGPCFGTGQWTKCWDPTPGMEWPKTWVNAHVSFYVVTVLTKSSMALMLWLVLGFLIPFLAFEFMLLFFNQQNGFASHSNGCPSKVQICSWHQFDCSVVLRFQDCCSNQKHMGDESCPSFS